MLHGLPAKRCVAHSQPSSSQPSSPNKLAGLLLGMGVNGVSVFQDREMSQLRRAESRTCHSKWPPMALPPGRSEMFSNISVCLHHLHHERTSIETWQEQK